MEKDDRTTLRDGCTLPWIKRYRQMMIVFTIISMLLVTLAAACNSIMDTVDHHQNKSIFSWWNFTMLGWKPFVNQKWWNIKDGWKNKYVDYDFDASMNLPLRRIKWHIFGITFNKPVQITDSWHFFKMWMIIFMCAAIVIFPYTAYYICAGHGILWLILASTIWLTVFGVIWNTTFSWTYHTLFILKDKR